MISFDGSEKSKASDTYAVQRCLELVFGVCGEVFETCCCVTLSIICLELRQQSVLNFEPDRSQ